jgi:hypothetical protein
MGRKVWGKKCGYVESPDLSAMEQALVGIRAEECVGLRDRRRAERIPRAFEASMRSVHSVPSLVWVSVLSW